MQLRLHGQKAHEKSAPKRHGRQPRTVPVPGVFADSRPGHAGQPERAPHAVVGSSGTGGHPPLALAQGTSLYCYGVDFNKNVSEVFDAQGTIAAAYDYSPYGTATRTGRLVQPVQWSGEMHDEELALAYYNYRYYNPKDGRWINRDPIAEEGGWNLYGMCGNASIIYVDYLGLEVEDDISSGFSGPFKCERNFIRKELKAGKVQNKLLNKIGIYDFKIRIILQNKKCEGYCKKNGNKGFSKAVSLSFQMEGEAGSASLNIFNLAEIRMGWYGRLGATGGISASYSSCSNAVSGGGCVNGYAELGLIAKAASRIGSLEVGARGGINFRTSICVTTNLDKFQVKGRGCISLRARVWASAKIWPLGKIDYNHEWQDQYCTPWIQLLQ